MTLTEFEFLVTDSFWKNLGRASHCPKSLRNVLANNPYFSIERPANASATYRVHFTSLSLFLLLRYLSQGGTSWHPYVCCGMWCRHVAGEGRPLKNVIAGLSRSASWILRKSGYD